MGQYRLVVSNPPQPDLVADQAAPILGLTPEQFVAKARYPVPEIWFAHPDRERADDVARALTGAGCRIAVFDSTELVAVPPRSRVRSFSFTDRGFVAHLESGDAEVDYEAQVQAVFCRPRETPPDISGGARMRRSSSVFNLKDRLVEAGASGGEESASDEEAVPFLDLFIPVNGSIRRFTVLQNAVSFSGLGRVQPRSADNMEALVGSCEDRFGADHVDRRLVGMRIRARGSQRVPGSEHRRGFSYASPGLRALLGALDRGLEHVSQPELSTRLAFLTHRHAA
jgi:hypothetical protein